MSSAYFIPTAIAVVVVSAAAGTAIAFKSRRMSVNAIVRCGLVAAIYVSLCLILQPLSFGAVQVRAAEVLVLLPVFGPEYIVGVTLGCFLANLVASLPVDALFGTLATMLAGFATYAFRHFRNRWLCVIPALPPIIFNAVIVGLEISFYFGDGAAAVPAIALNMVSVGLGEVVSCLILGGALVRLIEKNRALKALFSDNR